MTLRAIVIGVLAGLCLATFGFINDQTLRLESVVAGHMLPVSIFGLFVVLVLAINPLMAWARRGWSFRPAELAVMIVLATAGAAVPGRGLMEQFTQVLILPEHFESQQSGWQRTGLTDYVPQNWLVRWTGETEDAVINEYLVGAAERDRPIGLGRVPWFAWRPPLTFWGPIVLLTGLSMVCLALIVHSQWVHRERLRYPVAEFTESIIERPAGGVFPTIAGSRLFWWGFGVMLAVRLWNYAYVWFPENLVQIPLYIDLTSISSTWTSIHRIPQWEMIKGVTLYPAVVGFAFFLSTEISLTFGVAGFVYMVPMYFLVIAGVDLGTHYDTGGPMAYFRGAAYIGLALLLIHNGRRYYADLLRRAVGRRADTTEVRRYEIWALRLLVLAAAVVCGLLIRAGLPWPIALLTYGLTMISFLGVARISAETGLFFVQPAWQAYSILLGLFGAYAMGPAALVMVGLFCAVISIDQSMCLMPYVTNMLKVADRFKVPVGRSGAGVFGVFALGAVLATIVALWACYNWGMPTGNYWWSIARVPRVFFDAAQTQTHDVRNAGLLAGSEGLSSLQRLLAIDSIRGFWPFFLGGLLCVGLFGLLRNRFAWWPLHPAVFLVFGTFPIQVLWFSFLLGWAIKVVIVRTVGHDAYVRTKALFVGVIAGELLASLLVIAVGVVYFDMTGLQPESYFFWPR